MWCKVCQQDVDAQPSADQRSYCCPRCGAVRRAPPWTTDWEWDQQSRHIERVLHASQPKPETAEPSEQHAARFDGSHSAAPEWHTTMRPITAIPKVGFAGSSATARGWLTLGTLVLLCGGILLVWSLATGRQVLWNFGLPLAVAGQITLLAALALLMDRLGREHRAAAKRLDSVNRQIQELKTSAAMLSAAHGPSSNQFYAHLANGAGRNCCLAI